MCFISFQTVSWLLVIVGMAKIRKKNQEKPKGSRGSLFIIEWSVREAGKGLPAPDYV
jgi:hypothetical protein